MQKNRISSFAVIILAAFFLYFTNGKLNFAIAAWLYPLFMLKVSRNQKPVFSLTFIPIVVAVCYLFSTWKMTPFGSPDTFLFYLPSLGFGFVIGFIFFIDRILYSRITSFSSTFFFPLLYTTLDFLISRNPLGSWGMIGYTQTTFLPICQLASITGMCGLTFLITWFGSVMNWVLERIDNPQQVKQGLILFFIPLIIIITYGSFRLVLPLEKGTVRVAGIHVADKYKEGNRLWSYLNNKDFNQFRKLSDTITNRLIENTKQEAKSGAKIVEWSEVSPYILKKDYDSLIGKARKLARDLEIYLVITPFVYDSDSTKPENKVIIINPKAEVILTHYKFGGSFIEGTVTGNKIIPTAVSDYGNLSAIICWDADFPKVVSQVGLSKTNILFIPSADWKEIDPVHTEMAIFRAIENGCSIVRESQAGLSVITDSRGKIISSMDHYQSSYWSMVGNVPYTRIFTLYPKVGDIVGWLSIIIFIIMIYYNRNVIFKSRFNTRL